MDAGHPELRLLLLGNRGGAEKSVRRLARKHVARQAATLTQHAQGRTDSATQCVSDKFRAVRRPRNTHAQRRIDALARQGAGKFDERLRVKEKLADEYRLKPHARGGIELCPERLPQHLIGNARMALGIATAHDPSNAMSFERPRLDYLRRVLELLGRSVAVST